MMAIESTKTTDLVEVVERGVDIGGSRWVLVVADILAPGLFAGGGASPRPHRKSSPVT